VLFYHQSHDVDNKRCFLKIETVYAGTVRLSLYQISRKEVKKMCFRPTAVSKPARCECGTLNPPGAEKCRKCGVTLAVAVESFTCPKCGKENPVTATACAGCGLTAADAAKYKDPNEK
jgi:ribosomal protein L40E